MTTKWGSLLLLALLLTATPISALERVTPQVEAKGEGPRSGSERTDNERITFNRHILCNPSWSWSASWETSDWWGYVRASADVCASLGHIELEFPFDILSRYDADVSPGETNPVLMKIDGVNGPGLEFEYTFGIGASLTLSWQILGWSGTVTLSSPLAYANMRGDHPSPIQERKDFSTDANLEIPTPFGFGIVAGAHIDHTNDAKDVTGTAYVNDATAYVESPDVVLSTDNTHNYEEEYGVVNPATSTSDLELNFGVRNLHDRYDFSERFRINIGISVLYVINLYVTLPFDVWTTSWSDNIPADTELTHSKSRVLPGQPDLIVDDISFSPASPMEGQDFDMTVRIKNIGSEGAPSEAYGSIKVFDNGREFASLAYPSGQSSLMLGQTWSYTWHIRILSPLDFRAGTHAITARTDADGFVAESDETNNEKSVSLTIQVSGLPDLAVTEITWTPPNPKVGDQVSVTATISNLGDVDTWAGTVQLKVDGAYISGGTTYVRKRSQSPITVGTWTATAGTHTITVTVDLWNSIAESDETNNVLEKTITVGETALPDLTWTDLGVTYWPTPLQVGGRVEVTARLANKGGGTASAGHTIRLLLYKDRIAWDTIVWYKDFPDQPSLNVGQQISFAYTPEYVFPSEGTYFVGIVADKFDVISESNEDNNFFSTELTVEEAEEALPDLRVKDISLGPPAPRVGDTVTVTVTVENIGGAEAAGVGYASLDVYIDGSLVASPRGGPGQGPLPPGGTWTQAVWQTVFTTTGTFTIRVVVDPENRVQESNEGNNEATVTVNVLPKEEELGGEVKFIGTVVEAESYGEFVCYGSYHIKVRVEKILNDPQNLLTPGQVYSVAYGNKPMDLKEGEIVECYGYYYARGGPMQCAGRVCCIETPYYVKRV